VETNSLALDIKLIFLTGIAIISREIALSGVQKLLSELGADDQLKHVARRQEQLMPFLPPGAKAIVWSR
jgi:hypothetical protein